MEINHKKVFENYAKIDVKNLDSFENINFIHNLVNQMQTDTEDMYYEFLTKNGYKLDKPYKVEQIELIKKDLESKDKFIDYLEYTEFADSSTQCYHYILPFFNCISNPLTKEEKQEIIEKWKKNNRKDK